MARRGFLKILGAAFSAAALSDGLVACSDGTSEAFVVDDIEALRPAKTYSVVRPQDLLVLSIGLVNLKRAPNGMLMKIATGAVPPSTTSPSFVILDFPPQAILESACALTANGAGVTSIPPNFFASSFLGGGTRLVFQLPDSFTPVPFSLQSILDLCANSSIVVTKAMQNTDATITPPNNGTTGDALVDRVVANALGDTDPSAASQALTFAGTPPPSLPQYTGPSGVPDGVADKSVTQIEIPYRLVLSPNCLAGFSHASTPVVGKSGAFEVWHTVLGTRTAAANVSARADERNNYLRTARAIWTRDLDLNACTSQSDPYSCGNAAPVVDLPSLTAQQRLRIMQLTSLPNVTGTKATPIQVNRLMLSALGGYLDARGDFTDTQHIVDRWIHKMAGGRESYVEVDQQGCLLPFGNIATRVSVHKRNDDPTLGPIGTYYAFDIYVLRAPTVTYRPTDFAATTQKQLLTWPFVSIELKQKEFVCKPVSGSVTSVWPVDLQGNPIWVPVVARDCKGRAVHFEVPLYWVAGDPSSVSGTTVSTYRAALPPSVAYTPQGGTVSLNMPMAGQRIAYATSKRDDTSFATRTLAFDLQPAKDEPSFKWTPTVTTATIDVEALHSYTNGASTQVVYHSNYASNGLDPANNRSQLLFQLLAPLGADFTNRPDGGTGFVAPNMNVTAISRTTGPSYSPIPANGASMVLRGAAPTQPPPYDGNFKPSDYLGMARDALEGMKIFGVFNLLDIIKAVEGAEADQDLAGLAASAEQAALKYAPKFVSEGLSEAEKIISTIVALKSQVESVYTNAKEYLGDGFVQNGFSGAVTGALATARKIAKDQLDIVVGMLTTIVKDAKTLYATIGTTLKLIEQFDLNALQALAGDGTVPGSILHVVNDALELKESIRKLADYGARAAINAQKAYAQIQNGQLPQLRGLDPSTTPIPDPTASVSNAALQIAQGIHDMYVNKLQALLDMLGDIQKPADIMQRVTSLFHEAQHAIDALRDQNIHIEWQPKIGSYYLPGTNWQVFRPSTQHALTLAMDIRPKAQGDKSAGVDVSCRLDHFDLCLGPLDNDKAPDGSPDPKPVVGIQFDHISFAMQVGKKPDVDVKMNGIAFGGPLGFLNTLRKIIPLDGFSDPPFLRVDVDGIHAGFSLHIPNVAIGAFSLENLAISANLEIPFFTTKGSGKTLTFTFSFCDKDHPFLITVSLLGGGGYFVVSLTPAGVEFLEASICVGAQLAINLFDIAQGSVSIMAGITFTIDKGDVKLTAFLRLHGELDVCGIISVSVDVNVSLTYDITNKMLIADAKVHIEVSVLFFSISVDLPFHKEFHSCNNDPTLYQLMPPGPNNTAGIYWAEYCNAYA